MANQWGRSIANLLARSSLQDISLGLVPGITPILRSGISSDVSSGSFEGLWASGQALTALYDDTTAEIVEVYSNNSSDVNVTGIGAHKVLLTGLDVNLEVQTEVINLNGQNMVSGTEIWRRINDFVVIEAGTSKDNQGDIFVRHKPTPANVFSVIKSRTNAAMMCAISIPMGFSASISRWEYASPSSTITPNQWAYAELVTKKVGETYRVRDTFASRVNGPSSPHREINIGLDPGEDIYVRCSYAGVDTHLASASFTGLMFDKGVLGI